MLFVAELMLGPLIPKPFMGSWPEVLPPGCYGAPRLLELLDIPKLLVDPAVGSDIPLDCYLPDELAGY